MECFEENSEKRKAQDWRVECLKYHKLFSHLKFLSCDAVPVGRVFSGKSLSCYKTNRED